MNTAYKNEIDNKILVSCFIAGCLEMYDFLLFGFLAPIIHANYLSFLTQSMGITVTYLLFAVGFLFRPLGSLIFGYIGDVYGRKKAVVLSVSFMGIASLALALIPSYDTVGVLSCWLIVIARIIQGISVGGEYSGVTIYAIEHTDGKKIGIIGSIVLAGGVLGVLIATAVSKIVQNPAFPEYSWRLAFLLGFSLSLIGYFIRKRLNESPLFTAKETKKDKVPLMHGLKFYKRQFISSVFLAGANNANFYFILIFIPRYLKINAPNSAGFDTLLLTIIMLFLLPIIGWFSDRVGRLKILFLVGSFFVIYQQLLLPSLVNSVSLLLSYFHVAVCAIFIAAYVSTTNIFVLEIFPTSCRFSCGAVSYSIGTALIGGTAPFVCSYIIENFGTDPINLAYYMSFISILGFIGCLLMRQAKPRHI